MQIAIIIALSLHVLATVFWAGSTFVLARAGGVGHAALFAPQTGSGALAILSGGYLWHTWHESVFGSVEKVLAVGIACALVAYVVQVVVGARTRRTPTTGMARVAITQRAAALLLMVTAVCMVIARYV